MAFRNYVIFLTIISAYIAKAEDMDNHLVSPPAPVTQFPGASMTEFKYNPILSGIVVLLIASGLVVVLHLLFPVFGCQMFGLCYYQPSVPDSKNRVLQKRALEYAGPIFQALSAAYQTYYDSNSKKSQIPNYFRE